MFKMTERVFNKCIGNQHYVVNRVSVFLLLLLFSLVLSNNSHATVGGGQTVEFLGYEADASKIFVLRHYEDGCGRLPQLYYFDLTADATEQIVEVKSIYKNEASAENCLGHDEAFFNNSLASIKSRLQPLNEEFFAPRVELVNFKKTDEDFWYSYRFDYKIVDKESTNWQSKIERIDEAYSVNLNSSASVHTIPNSNYGITLMKYTGVPVEFRYTFEQPVLLHKSK